MIALQNHLYMVFSALFFGLFVFLIENFRRIYRSEKTLKKEKEELENELKENELLLHEKGLLCVELQEKLRRVEALEEELHQEKSARKELEAKAYLWEKKASEEEVKQQEQRKGHLEKIRALESAQESAQKSLKEMFKLLSSEALEKNSHTFLDLAKKTLSTIQKETKGEIEKGGVQIRHLVDPLKESLKKFDAGVRLLEKERQGQHESMKKQIDMITRSEKELREETANLVQALRRPTVRGKWGEMQLKRVVELAGMVNHCDFYEQTHFSDEEGAIRPDLIVQLPGKKRIIIDAKAPFEAFLEGTQGKKEEERESHFKNHAKQLRRHILQLGKKKYWEKFSPTPEFVVLFLPVETFFSTALEYDPHLIELAIEHGVVLATPTTLIGLLRAIAYGWQQEKLSESAYEVCSLGKELYKRVGDFTQHFSSLGRTLNQSMDAYNRSVGSFERRVLPSIRKFTKLGIADGDEALTTITLIDKEARFLPKEGQEEESGEKEQVFVEEKV